MSDFTPLEHWVSAKDAILWARSFDNERRYYWARLCTRHLSAMAGDVPVDGPTHDPYIVNAREVLEMYVEALQLALGDRVVQDATRWESEICGWFEWLDAYAEHSDWIRLNGLDGVRCTQTGAIVWSDGTVDCGDTLPPLPRLEVSDG